MDDFEHPRVRRLRGLMPDHPDANKVNPPKDVPICVKRIGTSQTREGTIPRKRIETIASEKDVTVLWHEPITFEVTRRAYGRGILSFQVHTQDGRKISVFEVLDVDEVATSESVGIGDVPESAHQG